jgi:hypothetical protein
VNGEASEQPRADENKHVPDAGPTQKDTVSTAQANPHSEEKPLAAKEEAPEKGSVNTAKAKEIIEGLVKLGAKASGSSLPVRGRNKVDVDTNYELNKDGWELGTATYTIEGVNKQFTVRYERSDEVEIYKEDIATESLTAQIEQGFIQLLDAHTLEKAATIPVQQQYDYKQGRLTGTENILQAQKTVLESKEYCSKNQFCVGFTFQVLLVPKPKKANIAQHQLCDIILK